MYMDGVVWGAERKNDPNDKSTAQGANFNWIPHIQFWGNLSDDIVILSDKMMLLMIYSLLTMSVTKYFKIMKKHFFW